MADRLKVELQGSLRDTTGPGYLGSRLTLQASDSCAVWMSVQTTSQGFASYWEAAHESPLDDCPEVTGLQFHLIALIMKNERPLTASDHLVASARLPHPGLMQIGMGGSNLV